MRFWLTLVFVIGIAVVCVKSCTGNFFGGKPDKEKAEANKPASEVAPAPAVVPADLSPAAPLPPPLSAAQPAGLPAPVEAPTACVYTFRHREPPENLATLSALGIVAVVDRQSRSVIVQGLPQPVSAAMQFLQASDTVGNSCSVQTWAVYVDRSAQKGFDLAAAIGAVTGAETTFRMGNGALTLDVSAGDVAAALTMIADGSTVEVIQRPHVRLTHGVPARIESTQEFPIPQTTLSNGIAQTAITYRKVGLQLEVLPYFLEKESVRLSVKQANGLIGNTVEIEGNAVPVIQSQTVETTAELTIGQTIILGGVQTTREKVTQGLFRAGREVTEGALYVVLSTFSEIPRAHPVEPPVLQASPENRVPFASGLQDPREWINGQILPEKGWERQEQDFVREHTRRGSLK